METRNIYLYQLMKSSNLELNKEETYLLSQLVNKINELDTGKLSISSFASEILRVMKRTNNFRSIDRLCFAVKLPLSNKLQIISSAMSDGMENSMDESYSCYVSKESSLFSISKEEMRVYDDIDDIVEKFVDMERPVQKSIFRLMKMGIKSGLTLPIEFDESFAGFLFLNSKVKALFSTKVQNLDLFLCMLKMVFEKVFIKYLRDMSPTLSDDASLKDVFVADSKMDAEVVKEIFEMCIYSALKKKVEVKLNIVGEKSYLIPVGQAVYMMKKLFEIVPTASLSDQIQFNIESSDLNNAALISIPITDIDFEELTNEELSHMRKTARMYGAEAIFSSKLFSMKFSLDEVDKNQFYSFANS